MIKSPFSRYAEAIRSIKLAIDLSNGSVNGGQVIGFTSSLPNEGKSTISASLALLVAQAGARVILVDCDLRNPALTRKLAPGANSGFLEVISGAVSFTGCCLDRPSYQLSVLACFDDEASHELK